jgi:hypothetical protein
MPFFWDVMLYHGATRPQQFEKTHCLHHVMPHHTTEEGNPQREITPNIKPQYL